MVVFEILQFGVSLITNLISSIGYVGVFFLMLLESALIPIPSEIIMPFSGYLVFTGNFNIWLAILAGTFGNLVGSIIAYWAGMKLGRKFILKYGKYILLRKHHLEIAENWFKKYGDTTIFFSRMLPAVRTYISLPAGIGKMDFKKFSIYTFVGSLPWNFALTYVGYWFGKNWERISSYTHILTAIVIVGVIIGIVYLYFRKKK